MPPKSVQPPVAVVADDPFKWPERGSLARALEGEASLRQRFQSEQEPYLTRWVNPKAIGVKSVAAMKLNARALELVASWWCPYMDSVKAVPIRLLRQEASGRLKHIAICFVFSHHHVKNFTTSVFS